MGSVRSANRRNGHPRPTPRGEPLAVLDDADEEVGDEEIPLYPGLPHRAKASRRRLGASTGERSGEALALFERFYKGLKGELPAPTENGICYRPLFPISSSPTSGPCTGGHHEGLGPRDPRMPVPLHPGAEETVGCDATLYRTGMKYSPTSATTLAQASPRRLTRSGNFCGLRPLWLIGRVAVD